MKKISIIIFLGCLLGLNMPLGAQSTGTENGHEWVDLGLPSGLKWATCNVGASSPEKSGNYYAWGETKPKDEYTQANSLTYGKQMDDISGNAQYDAATANWGGDWRMPTYTEMTELNNKCTWEWTKQNGVKGYKVTGPNGNSIFLPAVGYFYGTTFYGGSCGFSYYWGSTPFSGTSSAYGLKFDSGSHNTDHNHRYNGYSVRPVKSRVGIETPCVTAQVAEYTAVTAIIKTYATDGGAEITERGLYYATNPNPSETDNKVVWENETAWITNVLIDLTPNTTYYVKAYATNEAGTSYSEVVAFTTFAPVEYEYVDLGLPSGLKWATCNIGANSPEEYGNYYAWGEVGIKEEYTQSNSVTYGKQMDDISGNAQYDAATANWGGDWRMPTHTEMTELSNKCTWEWTTQNGVKGYKVTGPNSNYIFLPAAGYFNGASFNSGSYGYSYYWSSTTDSNAGIAYRLRFDSGSHNLSSSSRDYGYSVRPVKSRVGIETPCVTASVVEFTDITAIIKTYATDGGAELTERGFYWGTNPNPSETDNKFVLENTVGNNTNTLVNLTPNTTYYVKAYATNSEGTSYSEVVSFTTLAESAYNEYVDLGLPSGLKWATCNIGANSPEEYGNYYAWGEVLPKEEYTQSNSLTYGKQMDDISGTQYDAATANWGGDWRMPTKAEQEELLNNCTWTWTTQNGVNGYKVIGPSGASIFLPAAGYRNGGSLSSAGGLGYYWSSTPYSNTNNACSLSFGSGSHSTGYLNRYYGGSVRLVRE